MSDIKVYTLEEVCNILKINKRTIYTYVNSGKLKAVKLGKFWRVTEDDFKEFLKVGVPVLNDNRRKENRDKKLGKKTKKENIQ